MKNDVLAQAITTAKYFDIDHELVLAIIEVESNFEPYAIRFEPNWKYLLRPQSYARLCGITENTETVLQSCSFGLMQVMGTVAREYGFQENLLKLTQIEKGLFYGCKKLKSCIDKFNSNKDDAIAAYNAGSPVIDPLTKEYKNQAYVSKVKKVLYG